MSWGRLGLIAWTVLAGLAFAASVAAMPSPFLQDLSGLPELKVLRLSQGLAHLAGLLGLVAGLFGLLASRPAPRQAALPAPDMHEAAAALDQQLGALRALLEEERRQMEQQRDAAASSAHEAMIAGARLAGVALDAEARLKASVARAAESLPDPAARDAAMQRLEHALRQEIAALAAMVAGRAGLGGAEDGEDAAALRADRQSHVAALAELAAGLQRETTGLKSAAREIAMAGAGIVARMAETASQLGAAAAPLPELCQSVEEAGLRAVASLTEALDPVATQAESWRSSAARLCEAGEALHTHADAAARHVADAADSLARETDSWQAAFQDLRHGVTQLAGQTREAEAGAETRIGAALADADSFIAALHARLGEAARSLESRLAEAASVLSSAGLAAAAAPNEAATALAATADRAEHHAACLQISAEQVAQLGGVLSDRIGQVAALASFAETRLAQLPDLTAELAARAAQLAQAPQAGLEAVLPEITQCVAQALRPATLLDGLVERLERLWLSQQHGADRSAGSAQDAVLQASLASMAATFQRATTQQAEAGLRLEAACEHVSRAAAAILAAAPAPSDLPAGLRPLEEVDRTSQRLLRISEAMAEAAVCGRGQAAELVPPAQIPMLLGTVEATIRRLRATATALALASDGARQVA